MPVELCASDFEFDLPPELIARQPPAARDQSRLLVLTRQTQTIEHKRFPDLPGHLREGDLLVLNDSRVIPARLRGRNLLTGGHFEMLLLEETAVNNWWAMLKPGKRARIGSKIALLAPDNQASGIGAEVEEIAGDGRRRLRFTGVENILTVLDTIGETPLPPYLGRKTPQPQDRERYQTVYARAPGSVAAPTAGLHFTDALLREIRGRGVKICFVTLHVGAGTFAPVKTESLAEHRMHEERYEVGEETARLVAEAKAGGCRVVAAGTTTLRVLESAARENGGRVPAGRGRTALFLRPPADFLIVDALLTNFHLPRSTLLMLVSAFAAPGQTRGRELVLRAYREAVERGCRFFSYGDAMLLA